MELCGQSLFRQPLFLDSGVQLGALLFKSNLLPHTLCVCRPVCSLFPTKTHTSTVTHVVTCTNVKMVNSWALHVTCVPGPCPDVCCVPMELYLCCCFLGLTCGSHPPGADVCLPVCLRACSPNELTAALNMHSL